MIVLVGEGTGPKWDAKLQTIGWGRMFTIRKPTPYQGEPWGWDNGAYVAWRRGRELCRDALMSRIDRDYGIGTPLLAVAPDIVAAGERSLDFSVSWIDNLPPWPWYLAVQDGMTESMVDKVIHNFSGIFLGGSNGYKSTAPMWAAYAHKRRRPMHYGRAGTISKLEHAYLSGADSIDSTFPMWTKKRYSDFAHHWRFRPQTTLWETDDHATDA